MRLGFCFEHFCGSVNNYIRAAEVGYDYLEIPLNFLYELDESNIKDIKERIRESGIGIEASNVFFMQGTRIVGKHKNVEHAIEYSKRVLAKGQELGIQVAVLGSSGARNLAEHQSYEQGKEDFLPALEKIGSIAADFGIKIALEPLNTLECNFINTVAEAVCIVKEINHKNIGVTADYYHMATNKEDISIIKKEVNYIWHTHFADPNGRLLPTEENDGTYIEFVNMLKESGYNKRFSFEARDVNEFDKSAYFKKYI